MSIDSMFVHKMWDDHELSKMVDGGVPFPMLSDAGGKVGKLFGIFNEAAGVENRGRFLIDPDGVVQGYEVLTPPVGRNVNETLRQIQAFQLIRKTKGRRPRRPDGGPAKRPLNRGRIWWVTSGRSGRQVWPSTKRISLWTPTFFASVGVN